jgi:hypothetical protein
VPAGSERSLEIISHRLNFLMAVHVLGI